MLDAFETNVRLSPDKEFFTFVTPSGAEVGYTYRETRLIGAAIAQDLRNRGLEPGSLIAIDLPNCPEYVFLVFAAAFASFTLVTLNYRLTETEKVARLLELERCGLRTAYRVDPLKAQELLTDATDRLENDPLAQREIIHFAEHQARLYSADAPAIVMFTSGTTGKPKAVQLHWRQLADSAEAFNRRLNDAGSLWQAILPFYHVGGFQILVRSVLNRNAFRLYGAFDPIRVLSDAAAYQVTHISVVDKMLQDLLVSDHEGVLGAYRCVMLGGGPLIADTVENALDARVRLYASYGMTETASQVANERITSQFTGGMRLLDGYQVHIVDPDEQGFGQVAIKGPGVFTGYLNARAPFTVDGFFLTGDIGTLYEGKLFIRERSDDMFVSGGENVYPAQIVAALRRLDGVADALVLPVADATWGRRPVAIIEGTKTLIADQVRESLSRTLSRIYLPKYFCFVDELPRSAIGKIDRTAAERLYQQRIEIKRVTLYHIRLPFRRPFHTAKETLLTRDTVILEVTDHRGRTGLGECTAFSSDWYLPETLQDDIEILTQRLVPKVLNEVYLHPRDVSLAFSAMPEARSHPMACSALESALWDLYGGITHKPLWQLLNEEYRRVDHVGAPFGLPNSQGSRAYQARLFTQPAKALEGGCAAVEAGAVIGMGTAVAMVDMVRACVNAGYSRVKMKVAPGKGLEAARAVRTAFPYLLLTIDANQSFTENDIDELKAYDELNVGWIEEPLVQYPGADRFARLARLQRQLATPICLDESIENIQDAERALGFNELCCFAIKVGKFGGVEPSLAFAYRAQALGREVWMGGMYETGVSKRLHAAFETLPGIIVPGDIGSTGRYFDIDITEPKYVADKGYIILNEQDNAYGLGCKLNPLALSRVLVDSAVLE